MGRHCRSFPFDHKNRGLADQPTPWSDCGGSEAYDLSIASAISARDRARPFTMPRGYSDQVRLHHGAPLFMRVGVLISTVMDGREGGPVGSGITAQLVGDQVYGRMRVWCDSL